MAVLSALGFSMKAIFAKLAYRYGVGPVAVLALRMAFSLPFFLAAAVEHAAKYLRMTGVHPALLRESPARRR